MNINAKNIKINNEIQGLDANKRINSNQGNSAIAGSQQENQGCSKDMVVQFDFNKSGVYGEDKGEEFNTNAKEAIIKWREEKGLLADKDDSGRV